MARNPHYFSQLAHIEIYATNIEASINFFTDIVGLDETCRDENSVYFRAWRDYFHHTLKITKSDKQGMGADRD